MMVVRGNSTDLHILYKHYSHHGNTGNLSEEKVYEVGATPSLERMLGSAPFLKWPEGGAFNINEREDLERGHLSA